MASPSYSLLQSVERCLAQSVLVANGYNTNAGQAVTLEPAQVPDTAAVLLAVAWSSITRPDEPALRNVGERMDFVILAKADATDPDEAQETLHDLVADVTRAMRRGVLFFAALQHKPQFISAEPIPPQEGMTFIGAAIRYSAPYLFASEPPTQPTA